MVRVKSYVNSLFNFTRVPVLLVCSERYLKICLSLSSCKPYISLSCILICSCMHFLVFHYFCGWEWRHMITVAMNTTTKRLIIHEAESTHKYHHKHPLEIRSTRKKNWNKRLTKHLGNLKKTLVKLQVKLQVISRWSRARQCRGPMCMLLINNGVSPLVRIPAVTISLFLYHAILVLIHFFFSCFQMRRVTKIRILWNNLIYRFHALNLRVETFFQFLFFLFFPTKCGKNLAVILFYCHKWK